jgi:hypothetical protein
MSSNTDAIIEACSSCSYKKGAEERVFEEAQDELWDKIQCLESQVTNCGCVDEKICRHNLDIHLQISQHHISLGLNDVDFKKLSLLCERHKSLIHELEEEKVPDVSTMTLCCNEKCDVHCAAECD